MPYLDDIRLSLGNTVRDSLTPEVAPWPSGAIVAPPRVPRTTTATIGEWPSADSCESPSVAHRQLKSPLRMSTVQGAAGYHKARSALARLGLRTRAGVQRCSDSLQLARTKTGRVLARHSTQMASPKLAPGSLRTFSDGLLPNPMRQSGP